MQYNILKKEVIFKNRFLDIEKVDLKIDTFRGEPIEIERFALIRPNVVGVLVYIPQTQKIILVEQFRYSTTDTGTGWILEIVAGVIEGNDSPEQTARREVLEEAGYEVTALHKILTYYTSPGASDQYTHFFIAETTPELKVETGGGLEIEGEDIRVRELSVEEAYDLLRSGNLQDAMTLAALQHFFLFYLKDK